MGKVDRISTLKGRRIDRHRRVNCCTQVRYQGPTQREREREMSNTEQTCILYGGDDEEKFGKPMPLIGVYVAAASLVCTIAIAVDILRSFKWKKHWIASKFFPFNAATLTILAVAAKIPVDLTGAMPGLLDQLNKLSGLVIICIAMNHAMPSLGGMDDATILSNVVALGILVITVFVNVWIQIYTGLITRFAFQHIYYSITMLFQYAILVSHSLTVTTTKAHLEKQYDCQHREILQEVAMDDVRSRYSLERLRDNIPKYWLMALTSSPDYALRSFGMSHVSAFLSWLFVGVNFMITVGGSFGVALRSHYNWRVCSIKSNYKWSGVLIFLVQSTAIVMGTVVGLLRAMKPKKPPRSARWRFLFYVESYRVHKLKEWRKAPLPFHVRNRVSRKLVRRAKNLAVNSIIVLQMVVVVLGKFVLLCFGYFGVVIQNYRPMAKYFLMRCRGEEYSSSEQPTADPNNDLSDYVLHLEGEEEDRAEIANRWKDYPQKWIHIGETRQPSHLYTILSKFSTPSEGFRGVIGLYSDGEAFSFEVQLPSCWALSLVTLTCVVCAVFRDDAHKEGVEALMNGVDQSLKYVILVDTSLGTGGPMSLTTAKAAKMVWEMVHLNYEWFDVHLDRMGARDYRGIIGELGNAGEAQVDRCENRNPFEWPPEVMAANYMSRITKALLQKGDRSFEQLRGTVVDVIGACMTNLPRAIFTLCSSGTFGTRDTSVREAALALGETGKILLFLEENRQMEYPTDMEKLDKWCTRRPANV